MQLIFEINTFLNSWEKIIFRNVTKKFQINKIFLNSFVT